MISAAIDRAEESHLAVVLNEAGEVLKRVRLQHETRDLAHLDGLSHSIWMGSEPGRASTSEEPRDIRTIAPSDTDVSAGLFACFQPVS